MRGDHTAIGRIRGPQAKALLDAIAASGAPSYHTLSAVEARKTYKESRKFTRPATPPDVAVVEDRQIPGADRSIQVRHYRPAGSRPDDVLPVLVYFPVATFDDRRFARRAKKLGMTPAVTVRA
jgi:acetyl esterase/lipase